MPECELFGLVLWFPLTPLLSFDAVLGSYKASFLMQPTSQLSSSGHIVLEICNVVRFITEEVRHSGHSLNFLP